MNSAHTNAIKRDHTGADSLLGDAGGVLAVALFEQQHALVPSVVLGGVERVESRHVGTQLLHGACSERVASGDQHAESVLDEPEADLRR